MNLYLIIIAIICILIVFKIHIFQREQVAQFQNFKTTKKNLETTIAQLQNQINEDKNLIQLKKNELFIVSEKINQKKTELNNIILHQSDEIHKRIQSMQEIEQASANQYFELLDKKYKEQQSLYQKKTDEVKADYDKVYRELQNLKATKKAAYEAILKEKEIKNNKNNYRLIPSDSDLKDINSLQKIKKELHHPRILSMLIWQTYWQPLAKQKFPIILQAKTKMGIYKITNTETDQCYIGQSTDIYKRWNQHCKAGLGIDTPAGNKLYKAIQEYGLENFTFQLLLECERSKLDEKEKYFIELYQAKQFGYNSTGGNS